jgi:hypothetical protein
MTSLKTLITSKTGIAAIAGVLALSVLAGTTGYIIANNQNKKNSDKQAQATVTPTATLQPTMTVSPTTEPTTTPTVVQSTPTIVQPQTKTQVLEFGDALRFDTEKVTQKITLTAPQGYTVGSADPRQSPLMVGGYIIYETKNPSLFTLSIGTQYESNLRSYKSAEKIGVLKANSKELFRYVDSQNPNQYEYVQDVSMNTSCKKWEGDPDSEILKAPCGHQFFVYNQDQGLFGISCSASTTAGVKACDEVVKSISKIERV